MKRIEAEWQSYRLMVVPEDAGDIQLRETKKAFFAGAAALFDLQAGPDKNPKAEGFKTYIIQMMKDVAVEIENFKDSVRKGIE